MKRRPVPAALKAPPRSVMRPAPAGDLPHPRRPRAVRDVHGNELKDLFEVFPDLPRPALPPLRVLRRTRLRRYPIR
jgi:hypothetical protein